MSITHASLATGGVSQAEWDADHAVAGGLPGEELDYVENTSNVNQTGTTFAAGQTLVTGNEVIYDGGRLEIRFYAPYCKPVNTANASLTICLVVDGTDLGQIAHRSTSAANNDYTPIDVARFYTPAAGNHTFGARVFGSVTGGIVGAAAGGPTTYMPMFLRVTRA